MIEKAIEEPILHLNERKLYITKYAFKIFEIPMIFFCIDDFDSIYIVSIKYHQGYFSEYIIARIDFDIFNDVVNSNIKVRKAFECSHDIFLISKDDEVKSITITNYDFVDYTINQLDRY